MTTQAVYNFEALTYAINRDNAILLHNYNKITKRTTIYFRCHCGEESSKGCIQIVNNTGAFCKKCTTKNGIKKLHNTISRDKPILCNIDSLKDIIKRDNAILLNEYDLITKNTEIEFKCNCGENSTKNSHQLITVSGAFCKKCTRVSWTQKQKDTNLERYNVECTVHASHIKKQIKENNLEKYGVENVFQSDKIREKIKKTILEKYNVEYASQNKEVKEKTKQTCIERYNVENVSQANIFKEKQKNTIIERYNVEHYSQTPDFKESFKKTCLERYNVEHYSQTPEFKEKVKQSFIEHYGVDNPNKTPEIREKIRQTNIEKYGVEHPSQNQEIQQKTQKNAKKYKEYKMPSGTIRKVQGYEPFALDELVKTYIEEDIISDRKDIPRINYKIGDKQKYYFPDIYIPSKNKIIEVKSTWTYKCKKDNIQEKAEATKVAGYEYEVWIYDSKRNKTLK